MAIAFDITGSIAMFRRPYTTTSSVSFPLPPPTSVAGLLGAIIGETNGSNERADTANFWDEVQGTKIALSILNPISWFTGTLNFWNVKEPQKSPHIRVKHQFLRNPKYRIYVQGGIEERLRQYLERGTFIYTPYLGVAYAIADIEYLGEFEIEPVTNKEIALSSVLPALNQQDISIDVSKMKGIFRDRLPFRLNNERCLCETINTIYSPSIDEKIYLTSWEGLDVTTYRDQFIAWFPAW
jgi:CRISPR-associated protein Cas5h